MHVNNAIYENCMLKKEGSDPPFFKCRGCGPPVPFGSFPNACI